MEDVARDVAEPRIRAAGFRRRGLLFHRWAEGNLALLHLASSSHNRAGFLGFSINQGVSSGRIAEALGQTVEVRVTNIANAHWQQGAPMYDLPGRGSFQVIHDDHAAIDVFKRLGVGGLDDFIRTLDVMVADLVRHLSDEVLRDEWLEGANDRFSGPWASVNALILTRDLGPADAHARLTRNLRRLLARGNPDAMLARERGLI